MPIYFKKSLEEGGEVGIWNITEDISYFLSRMELFPEEQDNLDLLNPIKQREWLAARYLLHMMSGKKVRTACLKDEYGKPFLSGSNMHISMSHSHDLAAVMSSPVLNGIDIQLKVSKIERIAHKFLHPEEAKEIGYDFRLEKLHCYWGAKESIYKAYGRKSVDFKKEMRIKAFEFKSGAFDFYGSLDKNEKKINFKLQAASFEEYILVYALEK